MSCRSLLAVALLAVPLGAAAADEPGAARERALVHMVRQDCGACHGLTLRGGIGSPLTPEALRGKPAESLVATILNGRPGTPMPPFTGLVTEAEAQWVVTKLMAGFPADRGAP